MTVLIDETADPSLRAVIGRLLSSAVSADIAVSAVRLAALDLTTGETARVRRCRILLGRLDSIELGSIGACGAATLPQLTVLKTFLLSGRVEIRSAGVHAWMPDFSVYTGLCGNGPTAVCLVGAHYFRVPWVAEGPSLTCVLFECAAILRARNRFQALWDRAHDVLPAVLTELDHALHGSSF
jgi:hypothetical protein